MDQATAYSSVAYANTDARMRDALFPAAVLVETSACNTPVSFAWTAFTDEESGVDGYTVSSSGQWGGSTCGSGENSCRNTSTEHKFTESRIKSRIRK